MFCAKNKYNISKFEKFLCPNKKMKVWINQVFLFFYEMFVWELNLVTLFLSFKESLFYSFI